MPRLFVALRPPGPVVRALGALRGDVPGARWLAEGHLHVTLRFLGAVPDAGAVAEALAGVGGAPVRVELGRRAAYPSAGRARVLVAEGRPDAGLSALQRRVAAAVAAFAPGEELRFRSADLRFRPHVTVARLKQPDAAAVRRWLEGPPPASSFVAREVVLFESRPGAGGSEYVPLAAYALPGS
jgi:2'-5' RNA ligase